MTGVREVAAAVLLALAIPGAASLAAPAINRPPPLSQVGKPGPAEAARILDEFRRAGIPGHYYLDFELRALPRRGPSQSYAGRLWGGRNEEGNVSRIELDDGQGTTHRLLVQNGASAAVWRWDTGRAARLDPDALFEPVIPGVVVTAFDLQMPYLYWPDAVLENVGRVLGRTAHGYRFPAPAGFAATASGLTAARAYIDTQYHALLKTELLDGGGNVFKSFALVSLKTVERQPLPKTIDFLDARTRDKTRLEVRGVALELDLLPSLFEPAALAEKVAPPTPAALVWLD